MNDRRRNVDGAPPPMTAAPQSADAGAAGAAHGRAPDSGTAAPPPADAERLRLAFEASRDGFIDWDITAQSIYLSPACLRLLDYAPADIPATTEAWEELIHPDDRQAVMDGQAALLEGAEEYQTESRRRARDGSWRWLRARGRVVARDALGHPARVVVTLRDITAERLREEVLRRAVLETRSLALVAQHTSNSVVLLDPDFRIEWVNEAFVRRKGYSMEEVRGRDLLELLARDPALEQLDACRLHGQPFRGEVQILCHDGARHWLEVDLQPIRNSAGAVQRVILIGHDVTDRHLAEAALRAAKEAAEAANAAKSEFLANMSHEIRTPMHGIIGMAQLALQSAESPAQRDYLGTIRESAESLLAVINDILDLARIESGRMELEPVAFSPARLLEETLRGFDSQAAAKGLRLEWSVTPGVPGTLLADPARLRQVLAHLIGNAVKFTERGSITVQCHVMERQGDTLELAFGVTDTGIGIPRSQQERIFESFTQADASTTRPYGGSGLGLAICTRLVRIMGGAIAVDSEPGRGSTFAFSVRCSVGTEEEQAPRHADIPADAGVLLLCEPGPLRTELELLIVSWGADPWCAGDAEEALALVERRRAAGAPIRIAIVDGDLDRAVMADVHARLRLLEDRRGLPVILLGSGTAPGGWTRLSKPVPPERLEQEVAARLAASEPVSAQVEPAADSMTGSQSLDILVAEDNPVNQKLAVLMLEMQGHRVTVAANGAEAVRRAREHDFDLILMDVQMPVLDGVQATQAIREQESEADRLPTPVLALTANALQSDRAGCLKAGMNGFVAKPVRMAELAAEIARVVRPRREALARRAARQIQESRAPAGPAVH